MKASNLNYKETNYFSKLIVAYLDGDNDLDDFIEHKNSANGFKDIIASRNNTFINRELLVNQLEIQNRNLKLTDTTLNNISILKDENTFTVTTGHQLNYFTGPLYYIYKTASIIKLCSELKLEFPKNNFVPVFWMATEDHDFEEINHFRFKDEMFSWETSQRGAVGRMNIDNIKSIYEDLFSKLGGGKRANYLKELFSDTYLKHDNLAEATRFLVNELFGSHGLVIIDGDDKELKKTMIPAFKQELTQFISDKNISKTNKELKKLNHKIQVQQREINLFYLNDNFRERIVFKDGKYKILNSDIQFTKEEILSELENNPERFSPNAILRPLYEEMILPNLAYVGGGGELAYWFQLKNNFKEFGVSLPILILRNSLMLINQKQQQKVEKLDLSISDLFENIDTLIRKKVIENATTDIDISEQIEATTKIFLELSKKYKSDTSITPSIKALFKKQINGLYKLEKKLLKAEKRKQINLVSQIEKIKSELFPNNVLQERKLNFAEMYMEFGDDLIGVIIEKISVLNNQFCVINATK